MSVNAITLSWLSLQWDTWTQQQAHMHSTTLTITITRTDTDNRDSCPAKRHKRRLISNITQINLIHKHLHKLHVQHQCLNASNTTCTCMYNTTMPWNNKHIQASSSPPNLYTQQHCAAQLYMHGPWHTKFNYYWSCDLKPIRLCESSHLTIL